MYSTIRDFLNEINKFRRILREARELRKNSDISKEQEERQHILFTELLSLDLSACEIEVEVIYSE